MDVQTTYDALAELTATMTAIGQPLQVLLLIAAAVLATCAIVPPLKRWLNVALVAAVALLGMGEAALMWFHWELYQTAVVVSPETGLVTGRIAVPLWVESEKLYAWALGVGIMALLMRRHRKELLPGVAFLLAILMGGAVLWGRPFSDPLPHFLGQYGAYLEAMATKLPQYAFPAYQGMEGSRQYYYNTWYMWVHPPLLFIGYGAFTLSFVATLQMVRTRFSAYETTAYRWAVLGYLPLTTGLLLGFPWALMAWQGDSWWWSGKVNLSIMMWFLYTAYLHARLYLRRRGMWRWVAALAILSFIVLILTYLATYIVPGVHSYA